MDLLREKMRLLPMSGPQDMGGGGGGGSQTSNQTQVVDLPEWAKGYAQDVLSKGQALTDVSQNPYQAYTQPRIADLSSLQQTAMGSVASPEAFGQTVQGYMSPYMQNVVDVQKRAAREQAGIQAGALNARAAQAGAFGGSGIALQRAAGQRDLSRQLDEIQKMGSQAAFQQGVQQANTAIGQQTQLGALQQQQAQRPLDLAYQDFLTQKNYPYQQLSYMANLVRGTPMGMSTQSQVYQPPPTGLQSLGALGLGAYGMSKMFAEGGSVGGESVADKFHDPEAMLADMSKLTDQQLQQILQAPTTPAEAEAAQRELAIRASERHGLAGAYNQMPQQAQQQMVRAAGGGILAFAEPTEANNYSLVQSEDENDSQADRETASPGNPGLQRLYGDRMLQVINRMEAAPGYVPMTREQTRAAELAEYQDLTRFAGEDPYAPMRKRMEEADAERGRTLEQAKGLAALQAIPAILQPGGAIRGIGAAGAAFGSAYGQALQADRAEKRYLSQMQFNLADAQRKERLGLTKEARASVQASETAKLNAVKAARERDAAIGNMLGKGMQATRPTGQGGAGKAPKGFDALMAIETEFRMNPTPENLAKVQAARQAAQQWKTSTSEVGGTKADIEWAKLQNEEDQTVVKAVKDAATSVPYVEAKTPAAKKAVLADAAEAARKEFRRRNPKAIPVDGASAIPPPPEGFQR